MREIDLIPTEYRLKAQQRRVILVSIASLACVMIIVFAAFFTIKYMNLQGEQQINELQKRKAISAQQNQILNQLLANEEELLKQQRYLQKLTQGVAVSQLFETVDHVFLENKLWFSEWRFQLAGIEDEPPPTRNQSGLIIVANQNDRSLANNTNMVIRGQSIDHASVAEFARQLMLQPLIHDVRIIQTQPKTYNKARVIEFDLAIMIGKEPN